MVTFQDYEIALSTGLETFIIETMDKHIASLREMNRNEKYFLGENPFLDSFAKNSISVGLGTESTTINLSPDIKIYSGFFGIIVGHIVGRLWDNPVQIGLPKNEEEVDDEEEANKPINAEEIFGQNYSHVAHQMATYSAIHGVSYGFYNNGDVEMFKATEYLPFPDERTGEHRAGLRFWRVAKDKPWVVQLYTMAGYTEWKREHDGKTLDNEQVHPYRLKVPVGGEGYEQTTPVVAGEPYPAFPIVPLYTNPQRVSELTLPIVSKINVYDAKDTGYMDEALKMKFIMWVLKGYGGDPNELIAMLSTMRKLGVVAGGDVGETEIDAKQADIPYLSHDATLDRLEVAIYRDARIMNPTILMSGGVTTVAIKAAMQRENKKMVGVEAEARMHIQGLLEVAGVEHEHVTFTHKTLVNDMEIVQMLVQGLPDMPFEWRAKLSPAVPQEVADSVIKSFEAEQIGMDEEDIKAFEELKKRLMDEQADEQQAESA